MINLLPPEIKAEIAASRVNVVILRYIFMVFGAFVFMAICMGGTYFYMSNAEAMAKQTIAENEKKTKEYTSVSNEAQQFRDNLSVAKQILDKEVTYSKLMLAISSSLPNEMVITQLSLDSNTLGTPTVLNVKAKRKEDAILLKTALEEKKGLFSDVKLVSVVDTGGAPPYTVDIAISIVINKGTAS